MAETRNEMERYLLFARLMAAVGLVLFPVLVLFMFTFLEWRRSTGFELSLIIFVIVLAYAALGPLVVPVIEKGMIKKYVEKHRLKKNPYYYTFTFTLSRMAFAMVVYCYAMLVYLFSHNVIWTVCFLPVGIFWSYKFWPRRADMNNFLERIYSDAATIR